MQIQIFYLGGLFFILHILFYLSWGFTMIVKYTYFYSYKCIMQIQLIYLKFNSEKLKTNYSNLLKIL
jgi:hypothetical protein